MFEYIKTDSTGFEEKVKNLWDYYGNDIEQWSNAFRALTDKYYSCERELPTQSEQIPTWEGKDNKNIEKMASYYKKGVLDPMNMLLFINSVEKASERAEIINKLLDSENKYEYKFFGVPCYRQTPALGSFNRKDLSVERDEALWKLSNYILETDDIDYDNPDLKDSLKAVCEKFCKNGVAKVTSALFYLKPDYFIPLNKYTVELFTKDKPQQYTKKKDFIDKYLPLCEAIKNDEKNISETIGKDVQLFPILSAYLFYSTNVIGEAIQNFKNMKNIVLTGAPGTGKTYSIKKYLKDLLSEEEYRERVCFVQFHPNFDYSDFIDGIKPSGISDGTLNMELQNGIFKEYCKKAMQEPKKDFYFVIDEINRANLSGVFGEILNALEYRIKFENGQIVNPDTFITTQNSYLIENMNDEKKRKLSVYENYPGKFGVPENLYVLATMNNVDRSIDSFDLALRRRFVWIEMGFDENVLRFEIKEKPEDLIDRANKLNQYITALLGSKSYEIGHAYFLKISHYSDDDNKYALLWDYHLEPLVREYLRSEYSEDEIDKKLKCMKTVFVNNDKVNDKNC